MFKMKFQFGSIDSYSRTMKFASAMMLRPVVMVINVVTLVSFATAQPSPVVAVLDDPETQSLTAKTGKVSAATENDAFWKYSLLDVDGEPLPFSNDEQVMEFLREAEVLEITDLNRGITKPKKLILEKDGVRAHAVFRNINVFRPKGSLAIDTPALYFKDRYAYEVAAYQLSIVLGFKRVPPVVIRKVKGRKGSVQIWLEEMIMNVNRRDRKLKPPDVQRWRQQDQMLVLFDNIVGNLDRNLGNLLIDRSWTTWFIDHTRCFLPVKQPLYPEKVTHCERGVWRIMQNLDSKNLNVQMKGILNGAERRNLVLRFEFMVEHIRKQIAVRGEKSVLFNLRPAGPPVASWNE